MFTAAEARKLGVSSSLLSYYVQIGLIDRIQRGIYQNPEVQLEVDFKWAELIRVANSIPNGIVCLISALSIYDLTDEIPRQYWIAIPHATTTPKGRKKCKFVRMRETKLGKTKLSMGNASITIFNRERTIIDAFRYLGRETAIKALKESLKGDKDSRIGLKKLQLYSKKLRINIDPYILAVTT